MSIPGKIITLAILMTVIYSDRTQAQTETQVLQQIEQYSQSDRQSLEQVTNVNQLRDVSPTDWSYEALRSLRDRFLNGANAPASLSETLLPSEAVSLMGETPKTALHRYSCISGFPDGTYRGNQPITRNEFAAGLNSCLEQIERSLSGT